jgi:hypothetical protein
MLYQVVVLAGVFQDEDPAVASATGIKLLVDLLQSDQKSAVAVGDFNGEARALAADCVARLAHTRHGQSLNHSSSHAQLRLCSLICNWSMKTAAIPHASAFSCDNQNFEEPIV